MTYYFSHAKTQHTTTEWGEVWTPDPCLLKVAPDAIFQPEFRDLHEALVKGQPVACQIPGNVVTALLQNRVVICPSAELAEEC